MPVTKGTDQQTAQKAVIYCRVSSTRQRLEGSGLESQEHRCREYAESKGYDVAAVFPEDGNPNVTDIELYIDGVLQGRGGSIARALNTAES